MSIESSLSRRSFIQKASVGAAALSVPELIIPYRPKQDRVGVALVGLGNYSRGQLAPALQETSHAYLAGLVTGTPAKAEEWGKKHNIPKKNIYSYDNFDDIADNPDIDVVYIVLPNSMHAEYTIRAAEAGKHVICEKPMANSVEECRQMIAACKKANRQLSIGYRLHYEPFNQEMMRLGQEEVYGPLTHIEANFGFPIGDPTQWRLRKDLAGGGAMMDVGVYCIQGARYTTGMEPLNVQAQEFKTDPVKFAEVDETITWQMEFPKGIICSSSTTYAFGVHRLWAYSKRQRFGISPAYGYDGKKGETPDGPMNFPQVREQANHMDDFAQCLKEDRPTRTPGEMGMQDLRIIEAIYESIRKGGAKVDIPAA
ncbi:MAG: Gfo/Idh/MocA family oxidoreductase [Bacteroidota bacterium]